MRILQVDNMQIRRYGRVRVSPERAIFNGLIRANHKVEVFSDRDIASFDAPFRIKPLGRRAANRRLLEMVENFQPDMLLVGHADVISNATLAQARLLKPGLRIALRNVDALFVQSNVEKIKNRIGFVDAVFLTTSGEPLRQFLSPTNLVAYIPNASDGAVEDLDNSGRTDFDWDLLFCGVGNETDNRYKLVRELHGKLDGSGLRFVSFGMHGREAVWGFDYEKVLASAKMGLSLNRFEGWPLYASDRIAQLMGNGILTFVSAEGGLQRFFSDDMLAFFTDEDDLAAKALAFHSDDALRRETAAKGRAFYREHFSAERIGQFIVDVTMGKAPAVGCIWGDEVFKN